MCKTKLSKKMHVQPVMCMQMVGSENSHELVTLSTMVPTEHEAKPKTVNSTPGRSATADGSPVTMITALSMSFFRSDISSL
uniref:Uncharacterized protein n=1 Tax=Ditylenchus dipsaci TaxID=166011 RepID=A0A915DQM6_9BILA